MTRKNAKSRTHFIRFTVTTLTNRAMKKTWLAAIALAGLVACNNAESTPEEATDTTTSEMTTDAQDVTSEAEEATTEEATSHEVAAPAEEAATPVVREDQVPEQQELINSEEVGKSRDEAASELQVETDSRTEQLRQEESAGKDLNRR